MRILHYNDEERQLQAYLSERGHANTILPAESDPLDIARRQPFDAAFIGLHPHGLQLIRALHRRHSDCLVTMITADRNARVAVEAMKLGAFDYLLTPLDFTEVERTVIMMMREHEGQQERRGLEGQLTLSASADTPRATARPTPVSPPPGTLRQILAEVEQLAIQRAVQEAEGNLSLAARALGISRTTLYAKLPSAAGRDVP